MKLISFLILLFIPILSYSQQLNEYPLARIKAIQTGSADGMIGWEPPTAGGPSGPTALAITDNYIYVPDRVNKRIDVYTTNCDYVKSIYENGKPLVAGSMALKIDSIGNLISNTDGFGLVKIDPNGNEIFSIKNKDLPDQVNSHDNFFPIDNQVFIYNDKKAIQCISENGMMLSSAETAEKIKQIENSGIVKPLSDLSILPDNLKQTLSSLRTSSRYLIINDMFFSSDYYQSKEYFDKVKGIREFAKDKSPTKIAALSKVNLDSYIYAFAGYDNDHNNYWLGVQGNYDFAKDSIFIFTKYGELLDAFYYGQSEKGHANIYLYPATRAYVAIAPSGSIYFMVSGKSEYIFYKLERKW